MSDEYIGKLIVKVQGLEKGSEEIKIHFEDGSLFYMKHFQDCCECVSVEDIDQTTDLVGTKWQGYEETYKEGESDEWGSSTWSFYHIYTSGGYVWVRWYGSSNGYYSESASCGFVEAGQEFPYYW